MPSDELLRLLGSTVGELEAAGIPDEALATLKLSRFAAPKLVKAGRAWRLGVLLIDRDLRLYEAGEVTRAVDPPRGVANKSAEAEARREMRRAATRGRFPEGEVVNFGYRPIDLETGSGPIEILDGLAHIHWRSGAPLLPLEQYLVERLDLARGD